MDEEKPSVRELADREPRSDPSQIYDDLELLPRWWRQTVEEFKLHDLRTYRPSQFKNGEIVRETIDCLEAEHDVRIIIKELNPNHDDTWTVFVDGEPIRKIEHKRKPEGFTEYGITSDEFVSAVNAYVDAVE